MANWFIALFIAIPAAFWIYPKITNKTGGNTQSSMIVAGVAGILIFFLALIIIGFIPN